MIPSRRSTSDSRYLCYILSVVCARSGGDIVTNIQLFLANDMLAYYIISCFIKLYSILFYFILLSVLGACLQCFDAVGWAAGRASGL